MKHRKLLTVMTGFIMLIGLCACRNDTGSNSSDANSNDEIRSIVVHDNNDAGTSCDSDKEQTKETDEVMEDIDFTLDDNYKVSKMYTDPVLMNQTESSIDVVWFTKEPGEDNEVIVFSQKRCVKADTSKLSRIRGGNTEESKYDQNIYRDIYRHSATIDKLPVNDGTDNAVVSYCVRTNNEISETYTLKAAPITNVPMKILITSDLQNKLMCAANIEMAFKTIPDIDAVLVDGDMSDVADSAYNWFDSDNSFFKVMQGNASVEIGKREYKGAPILQNAPIFTALGNHEYMGVLNQNRKLDEQFNNPQTRQYAEKIFSDNGVESREEFVINNSFNTITYDEIFGKSSSDDSYDHFYAFTLGDARIIVLEVNRVWRLPTVGLSGKYSEIPGMDESSFGFGQFIFEPVKKGSRQYDFLTKELAGDDFKNAKYKVVMYHFDNHSLGGNCIPPFTDPVKGSTVSPITGQMMVTYDYPIEEDYLNKQIFPLFEENNVSLVINGHSHLWNRFKTESNVNILQSSNVGNNYGGFIAGKGLRTLAPSAFNKDDQFYLVRNAYNADNYVLQGDPQGLEPEYPNVEALPGNLPYLSSNEITAFSILDTGRGVVDSYYYDTTKPDSEVVLFDSFSIE